MPDVPPPLSDARWFPRGAVASPHHLASAAGAEQLRDGGNAVDAAVAANLVLAVVTPHYCGAGGDLLAIVWDGDRAHGVSSVGAMPAGASPSALRAAIDAGHGSAVALPDTGGMPTFGALPVTVPGAVAGWSHLLDRFGSRSFATVAARAIELAADGFVVSKLTAAAVERARPTLFDQPGWAAHHGRMRAGRRHRQPDLAASLQAVADLGPQVAYRGWIAERIVATLQAHGSTMTLDDLAAHEVAEVAPLAGGYRDRTVLQLPPPTQGVTALTALGLLDRLPARGADAGLDTHREVEAVRLALRDRQRHLADPRRMRTDVATLLAAERLDRLAAGIGEQRDPFELRRPAPGGTAYLCAADDQGRAISLIQSNFVGFGSGVVADGTGIGLHDRGAHLRLDGEETDSNVVGSGVVPLHTLIPGMLLQDGELDTVFGTMGGDAQAQIHAQLLRRWIDADEPLQQAISAPRWAVDVADQTVVAEGRLPDQVVADLRMRGHEVRVVEAFSHAHGHAHALRRGGAGWEAASDPRCEGAALGW